MKKKVQWILRRAYGAVYFIPSDKETKVLAEAYRLNSLDSAVRLVQDVARTRDRDGKDIINWYPRPIVRVDEPVYKEISIGTVLDWEDKE